jgi:ribosome-binding factor A
LGREQPSQSVSRKTIAGHSAAGDSRYHIPMQPKRRPARLGSQLREEIGLMLQREVKDPRIGFVTVTDVHVTADCKLARIYVSVLGSEEERRQSLEGLNQAAGFIRFELGHRLRLRFSPELEFRVDDSLEKEARLEELFGQIHNQENGD